MSLKKYAKIALLAAAVAALGGCSAVEDLFGTGKKAPPESVEVKPIVKQAPKAAPKKKPRRQAARRPAATGPVIDENGLPETVTEAPTLGSRREAAACEGDPEEIEAAFGRLASDAGYSFEPRQPNLVMVSGVSAGAGVCRTGVSYSAAVRDHIGDSGRLTPAGADVSRRILQSASGTSYAYLVRVAKSQNIDYLVSGVAAAKNGRINLVLKITDIKSGATVWQRTDSL